jgi:hypothetical protein
MSPLPSPWLCPLHQNERAHIKHSSLLVKIVRFLHSVTDCLAIWTYEVSGPVSFGDNEIGGPPSIGTTHHNLNVISGFSDLPLSIHAMQHVLEALMPADFILHMGHLSSTHG